MKLDTKVSTLNRVGEKLKSKLKHLGIEKVQDLLDYYPFRYEDYSKTIPIRDLRGGDEVTVRGTIELISSKRSQKARKIITEAVVVDDTDRLRVVWFGQPFITKQLHSGDEVFFSGKVIKDIFGIQMKSPAFEKCKKNNVHTARIVPMYSLTSGITQKQIRFLVDQVIDVSDKIEDWLPKKIRDKARVIELSKALRQIHFPANEDELAEAKRRLKFDELYILQLRAEMVRQSIQKSRALEIEFKQKQTKEFVDSLPFTLTNSQKISAWEILQDLEKNRPMNRMLEGDVGSGKTVVSAIVLYNSALNGYQAVLMAPTEILAKQHYESLLDYLGKNIKVGLLTRVDCQIDGYEFEKKSKVARKKEMVEKITKGEVGVVVGTHALLVEKVEFKNLGLTIVDEQHRFGVEQRKKIREQSGDKQTTPHFLSMTATPIPRSLALSIYGELDLSIIREMPKGRKPVKSRLVDPKNRDKAYDFIREQVKQGRQVFVICPLISQDESSGANIQNEKKTVMEEYEKLDKTIFPDLNIGFLHGKMKVKDKDEVMKNFVSGKINILVSTSVVEVGVDIPNATVMMIEGAERFGLAQLHQFRGRVGRSDMQSYCFLFSDSDSEKVSERLHYFESTTDGFKLAEYDLKLRGPGEVYGKTQSGMMNFRIADLRDIGLIKLARDLSKEVDFDENPVFKEKVEEWEGEIHLE